MKNNYLFDQDNLLDTNLNNFDQMVAGTTCITTPHFTPSGRPGTKEYCFDNSYSSGPSGLMIFGVSSLVLVVILYIFLCIKKNNKEEKKFKIDSAFTGSSLNNQLKDSSLTDLLAKLKNSYFPKLSIAESFIKGNYLILKDLSGNIISESSIKGNYVIVTDLNGNVISEVKFKK